MVRKIIYLMLVSTILNACASWNNEKGRHQGVCNTLKSKLVFGGATPEPSKADMQQAELPLVQHTYDQEKCE